MIQSLHTHNAQSLCVGLHHRATLHYGDNTDIGALHNQLKILLSFAYLQFCVIHHILDTIERVVYQRVARNVGILGETERVVVVLHSIKYKHKLLDQRAIDVEQTDNT